MQGEENDYHYVVGAEPGNGFLRVATAWAT